MRFLIALTIVPLLAVGGPPAFAQGNPSSQQIINSLRPTGNLVQGGTRGIRLAAPPSDTGAPSTAPSQQPRVAANRVEAAPGTQSQPPAGHPSVNLTVNFAFGSAELTPDAMRTLNELGRALASKDLASYRFRIEGHTDTVGTKEQNLALSERRAAAVVDYVTKKFGVDPSKLQAIGVGESDPLVPTPDQTPEPRNRRVQVVNLSA